MALEKKAFSFLRISQYLIAKVMILKLYIKFHIKIKPFFKQQNDFFGLKKKFKKQVHGEI